MISIICAMGKDRAIGRGGALIWRIPEDLQRFKRITLHHPVIMGRRTYESIGHPLTGRLNIVISRDATFHAPGCRLCCSLHEAIDRARHGCPDIDASEIFIIGGAEIYTQALPLARRLYLTHIDAECVDADCHFPSCDDFGLEVQHSTGKGVDPAYEFVVLERTSGA